MVLPTHSHSVHKLAPRADGGLLVRMLRSRFVERIPSSWRAAFGRAVLESLRHAAAVPQVSGPQGICVAAQRHILEMMLRILNYPLRCSLIPCGRSRQGNCWPLLADAVWTSLPRERGPPDTLWTESRGGGDAPAHCGPASRLELPGHSRPSPPPVGEPGRSVNG